MTEHKAVKDAREGAAFLIRAAQDLKEDVALLIEREHELGEKNDALERRATEADQRAALYEERNKTLQAKADRHDRLDQLVGKLLEAFARLPKNMEEAGVVPSAVKQAIPLYGTYEWQAVMNQILPLEGEMNRKEKHGTDAGTAGEDPQPGEEAARPEG